MTAQTLTIVFTDIKDFTARTSSSSRAEMVTLLQRHEELMRPLVLAHGGTVVKTIGDAFLLTFQSPTNAVLCGLRLQARLRQYNREAPAAERIQIRIAINTGEVEVIGNDVFGDTVNLASRVEGVTEPGETYFTEATYLVMNKHEVPTSQVGEFRFKGIPEAVRLYKVLQDENLELYRRVVESQAVPDEVAPEEASVPEGALSTRMLLALEQQRAMAGRRHWTPVVAAVTAVLLTGLLVGGYLAYRTHRYNAQRDLAEQMVEDGRSREALDLLSALRRDDPADPELYRLLTAAVRADINRLHDQERFREGLRRLEALRERYPDLAIHEPLERRLRLGEIEALYRRDRERAHRLLRELAQANSQDLHIKFRLAYHYAETFGGGRSLRYAMRYYREVVQAEPETYRDNRWVRRGIERYLASFFQPQEDNPTLAFIDRHYYNDLRPLLLEHIADPGAGGSAFRRNAYTLLEKHGDLTPRDEFRFFTAELFYRSYVETTFRQETFAYFENLLQRGPPRALREGGAGALPPAEVLKETSPERERALPIVRALFPAALEATAR